MTGHYPRAAGSPAVLFPATSIGPETLQLSHLISLSLRRCRCALLPSQLHRVPLVGEESYQIMYGEVPIDRLSCHVFGPGPLLPCSYLMCLASGTRALNQDKCTTLAVQGIDRSGLNGRGMKLGWLHHLRCLRHATSVVAFEGICRAGLTITITQDRSIILAVHGDRLTD